MSKKFELKLDKVVVGSSLEAVLFAYYNQYKFLYTKNNKPHQLDKIDDFGMGISPLEIWNKHIFLLSLAGYNICEDKIQHIVYADENTLKVVTKNETIIKIKFNKLYVFDDYEFMALPGHIKRTSDQVRIVDWFRAERGDIHEYDIIENNTRFMNQVIFYQDNHHKDAKRKDVCVISYCNKKELDDIPEHLVKIKTESLMRSLGIETANKHKTTIKLEHTVREVTEYGQNVYENFDNVEFLYHDAKFIYDINQRRRKIDYMKYVEMKLNIK